MMLKSRQDRNRTRKIVSCYLCGYPRSWAVAGTVRDRPDIGIRECKQCGLVYLDTHSHITKRYYSSKYEEDLFKGWRWQDYLNYCRVDDDRRAIQILPLVTNRSYLDVGCGAGGVILKVRENCRFVAAIEPMRRWRDELKKRKIRAYSSIDDLGARRFSVISLFHALEHIPDPIPFLRTLKNALEDGGTLVIEVPNAKDALLNLYKNKAFSQFNFWSPHLYLYNPATLKTLLSRAGFSVINVEQFQRYPLSNHLYWLAKGKPGGHAAWSFLDSHELTTAYMNQLARLGQCDTLIAWVKTSEVVDKA